MKQTKQEQAELLQLQNSVEKENESSKISSELIHREDLGNGPMQLIQSERGWFAALGLSRLTEYFETKEELEKYTETWQFQVITITEIAVKTYEHIIKE